MTETNYVIVFVLAGIVIIGAGLFGVIIKFSGKNSKKKLNVDEYRVKFLAVENQLKYDDPASHSLAVLNADKIVDQALREIGFLGETMGERMKTAEKKFSNNNAIWAAHKLRNEIAHETDTVVSYDEAKVALASFKKALKDLGAI